MDLVDRLNAEVAQRAETRTFGGVSWQPWNDPTWRFDAGGPVHPSRTGTGSTDGALRLAPLYACVRFIAEGVGKLPVKQYRSAGDKTTQVTAGQLLMKPSAFLRPLDWKVTGMTSVLLHGMAYGMVTSRDGYGFATSVEWLPAQMMTVVDSEPFNPAKARFFYAGREIRREDLFIVRGLSVAGRTEAVSPLKAFQMLIEAGHDALAYGSGWYKSGGFPPGTFKNSQYEITDEQTNKIKRKLVQAQRRREPLVFGRDWDYTPITVPPEQAQFIESQRLTATQLAAIYGVMPERVGGTRGDSMTYSTQEANAISEITDTLDPWLIKFEEAYTENLPAAQYAEFDRDARIRHDITTRYNAYRTARDIGLMNVDELRDQERKPPLPKAKTEDDYDGTDYTPLQIQVAAARGLKQALGEGPDGEPEPAAAPEPGQQALPGMPPMKPMPLPVASANGSNGNGKKPASG